MENNIDIIVLFGKPLNTKEAADFVICELLNAGAEFDSESSLFIDDDEGTPIPDQAAEITIALEKAEHSIGLGFEGEIDVFANFVKFKEGLIAVEFSFLESNFNIDKDNFYQVIHRIKNHLNPARVIQHSFLLDNGFESVQEFARITKGDFQGEYEIDLRIKD